MSNPHIDGELVVDDNQEILSCRVAGTEFGLPMTQLREVVDLVEIVRVQRGSSLAEGIINFRGTVIPVVDARKALGLARVAHGLDTHIVITDICGEKTGLIVDRVLDVLAISSHAIERPGPRVPLKRFVSGIAKLDDRLLLILDLEALVSQPVSDDSTKPLEATEESADDQGDEQELAVLRQRAQELSKPIEQVRTHLEDIVTMVCFNLSKGVYAIRANYTREIVTPPRITPIPCTPDSVLGAVNIRGVIMPVLSLAAMLGVRPTEKRTEGRSRIVVGEVNGALFGMFVDQVAGILEVSSRDFVPALGAIEMQTVGFIEGEFDHEGRAVCAIDAPAIVEALEQSDRGMTGRLGNGASGASRQGASHG